MRRVIVAAAICTSIAIVHAAAEPANLLDALTSGMPTEADQVAYITKRIKEEGFFAQDKAHFEVDCHAGWNDEMSCPKPLRVTNAPYAEFCTYSGRIRSETRGEWTPDMTWDIGGPNVTLKAKGNKKAYDQHGGEIFASFDVYYFNKDKLFPAALKIVRDACDRGPGLGEYKRCGCHLYTSTQTSYYECTYFRGKSALRVENQGACKF